MNNKIGNLLQIEFDDNSILSSLFGIADKNIHLLEKLNNVSINYRGNIVKIIGKHIAVEETKLTLKQLFEDAKNGQEIDDEKIKDTKSILTLNSDKKSQLNLSKVADLYLDSLIAPSALNEKFYDEIECLAPFGSGSNEPKFAIENLQVVASNYVGNNHIKSVLCGKDGSVIKSIAFDAKNSPLEPFLDKKNKKKINVAGKMNLNDWKGKRSIEFVIEDISL